MQWTTPNILTILRLIAALLVALAFIVLPRPYADIAGLVLFSLAAMTDWLDGYLARSWKQGTKLGAMLDPIADKAMVVLALAALLSVSSLSSALLLPAALILFREVFVSGLREFLGETARALAVTRLAKWKTAVQMLAISLLMMHGIAEHYVGMGAWGMDEATLIAVLNGELPDEAGLRHFLSLMNGTGWAGMALLWSAAGLTLFTGVDYFLKALPHLREPG